QTQCQQTGQRFAANTLCSQLNPLCGVGFGGCCLSDGGCQDLSQSDCQTLGGTWDTVHCAQNPCTPLNGLCANAILVSNGITVFDTTGAVTDGPTDAPVAGCTQVNQDIWYHYISSCAGAVTVSLCGSNFDTALWV